MPACRAAVASAALAAGLAVASCASGAFTPPTGPAQPAPSAARLLADATRACARVRAVRAQVRVSGRLAGRRVPTLTVGAVATGDAEMGLDARVGGSQVFVLAGRAEQATLLLSRERRVVNAPAADIVEALTGASLGPDRLLAVLSGCGVPAAPIADAVVRGDVSTITLRGGDVVYLRTRGATPVVRAAAFGAMQVDYRRDADGWPSVVTIRSATGRQPVVAMTLRLDVLERDPVLPATIFSLTPPADAAPLSVEELRTTGPLG